VTNCPLVAQFPRGIPRTPADNCHPIRLCGNRRSRELLFVVRALARRGTGESPHYEQELSCLGTRDRAAWVPSPGTRCGGLVVERVPWQRAPAAPARGRSPGGPRRQERRQMRWHPWKCASHRQRIAQTTRRPERRRRFVQEQPARDAVGRRPDCQPVPPLEDTFRARVVRGGPSGGPVSD
jgi:hypothetical protein